MKEFFLYTKDPDLFRENFKLFNGDIQDYELRLDIQEDTNWEFYRGIFEDFN